MLVKDLLEQTKESILIERSIQLTELPYDIVNTRASRRKAEKQLQKKYKKLIAAILRLDPVLSGEMITFDMDEGDFMKDGEMLPVKFMDWKKLLGMDICLDGHDENDQQWIAAFMIRYMTWYHQKYSDCGKSKVVNRMESHTVRKCFGMDMNALTRFFPSSIFFMKSLIFTMEVFFLYIKFFVKGENIICVKKRINRGRGKR